VNTPFRFYTVGEMWVNERVDLHKVFTFLLELSRIWHRFPPLPPSGAYSQSLHMAPAG